VAVALLEQKSTTDPEIEGSNPATTWHQEKIADKKYLVIVWSVVVTLFCNESTTDPKIECLNPARAWHKGKMEN
jgi:hypothetical protein